MNVHLDEALEAYVRELIASGKYNNASEVVRDALRLKMREDEQHAAKLEALRADVAQAQAQIRHGEVVEVDPQGFLNRGRR